MKIQSLLTGTLILACLFVCPSCANTDTPTGRAIGAGLHQQAAMRSTGAFGASPQRTGMQEFFARGGAQ